MAKVINPLMSAAARGKVGGLIFNIHRGINTVKGFKSPSQPRTARQLAVRAYLSTLSRGWSTLTAAQRTAWTDWANAHTVADWTGTPIRMTGENAYIKLNSLMLDQGQSAVTTPPAVSAPANVAGLAITPSAGQLSIAWTATTGTDKQVDVWLYGPHSAGRTPSLVKAKHNCYCPGETSPKVITGLASGLYTVFARVVSETDGQVSSFVSAQATVP